MPENVKINVELTEPTSDFSVKGYAHTTHSIVGCSCNLAGASSSMSAKTQEEKVAESKGSKRVKDN